MDGMVIRANCVGKYELFLKKHADKLLKLLHPPSRSHCESALICK